MLGKEHISATYRALNPGQAVPTLVLDNGQVLTQSMAILDWLEDTYPHAPLLPSDAYARAQVRAAAHVIALDVHPINNLRVMDHLKSLGHTQNDRLGWMRHWMTKGFETYQNLLPTGGRFSFSFSFGESITQADLCLSGQMINAIRWGVDMTPFGRLTDIDNAMRDVPAIVAALPEAQPDAQI